MVRHCLVGGDSTSGRGGGWLLCLLCSLSLSHALLQRWTDSTRSTSMVSKGARVANLVGCWVSSNCFGCTAVADDEYLKVRGLRVCVVGARGSLVGDGGLLLSGNFYLQRVMCFAQAICCLG